MTTPIHRASSVAILILTLAVFGGFIVVPVISSVHDLQEQRVDTERRVQILEARRSGKERLQQRLSTLQAGDSQALNLIPTAADSEAVEILQSSIKSAALTHNAEIATLRSIPPANDNGMRIYRLEVTLRIPRQAASNLIAAIEDTRPMLSLEQLRIGQGPYGGGDRLEMTMTLRAYGVATVAGTQP